MKYVLIALLACFTVGCAANKPPNLTPEATKAFYGTEVIKDLDRVRDIANDAHATTPPILTAQDALAVVNWHDGAIDVVHAAKAGWQAALRASIDTLKASLSPVKWAVIQPYVQLVLNIIKEVQSADGCAGLGENVYCAPVLAFAEVR